MKQVVAIVGRPNVGKSTLFNKIIGSRKAIASDEPGVTRDLNFAEVVEGDKSFTLVDTGGFESKTDEEMALRIREQALLAIEESDIIVFLMDGRGGVSHEDREIVEMLRKVDRPVLYAVNKIDTAGQENLVADFYSLGIDPVIPVSGEHGLGVYELVAKILELVAPAEPEIELEDTVRVAIVGRPNAGKSSIVNRVLGKKRAIVSDTPGTTRDTVDTPFTIDGKNYVFIDTAGIRKKNKVSHRVESYSVMAAVKAIDGCDVALLVVDATGGIKLQDEKIAGLIERRGKGVVIVVNKWDLIDKDTHTVERFAEKIHRRVPFLSYAPIVFVSALTGKRLSAIFDHVDEVWAQSRTRVTTNKLNKAFDVIKAKKSPPMHQGRNVKFYYITQTSVAPPSFVVFSNYPQSVPESYRRYMLNSLRATLGVDKVPLRLYLRLRT